MAASIQASGVSDERAGAGLDAGERRFVEGRGRAKRGDRFGFSATVCGGDGLAKRRAAPGEDEGSPGTRLDGGGL